MNINTISVIKSLCLFISLLWISMTWWLLTAHFADKGFDPINNDCAYLSTFSNRRSVAIQIQRTLQVCLFFFLLATSTSTSLWRYAHNSGRYLISMIWIKEFLPFQLHLIITKQRSTTRRNVNQHPFFFILLFPRRNWIYGQKKERFINWLFNFQFICILIKFVA